MKKQFAAIGLIAAAVAFALTQSGQPEEPVDPLAKFMRAKLEHAENVLEGLATEDFQMIAKNAQDISLLSQASTWQVFETPEYIRQSSEFRRAADDLTKAGKEKNLDGAALAYVAMTMKCVACHKYVRGVRMATAPIELPTKR